MTTVDGVELLYRVIGEPLADRRAARDSFVRRGRRAEEEFDLHAASVAEHAQAVYDLYGRRVIETLHADGAGLMPEEIWRRIFETERDSVAGLLGRPSMNEFC